MPCTISPEIFYLGQGGLLNSIPGKKYWTAEVFLLMGLRQIQQRLLFSADYEQ
jgi:hypothetical protein